RLYPARLYIGNIGLDLSTVQWNHLDTAPRKLRHEVLNQMRFIAERTLDASALCKKSGFGKHPRQHIQEIKRSRCQRLDFRPTIAFRPECRRPPGRMMPRLVFRFKKDDRAMIGNFGSDARPRHSCSDDSDIIVHGWINAHRLLRDGATLS